jgi:hypothetical protein
MRTLPKLTSLPHTAAIVGAGFSVPAGVPPTSQLSQQFLSFNRDWPTAEPVQQVISENLRLYWNDVFGFSNGGSVPSFEDHFTLLDLAANVGHNLGHAYTPGRLRALRRISIHRVFEILDVAYRQNKAIRRFLRALTQGEGSSVISLNWDIVVENHLLALRVPFRYGIPGRFLRGQVPRETSFPVVKLHGSANWHYCDSCHTTLFGGPGHGKTTIIHRTFLEPGDFRLLIGGENVLDDVESAIMGGTPCIVCHNRKTTARVATFSYAKAFDFFPFHASWHAALQNLRSARRWIFIGYSLPEADFAFKHLLKTAQLAAIGDSPKEVHVVVKETDDTIITRYRQFFGRRVVEVFRTGFEDWVAHALT